MVAVRAAKAKVRQHRLKGRRLSDLRFRVLDQVDAGSDIASQLANCNLLSEINDALSNCVGIAY